MKNIPGYVLVVVIFLFSAASSAREQIEMVGSSTVYPFAQRVAERFVEYTHFSAPNIQSTGTGKGAELFCQGLGNSYPDIVNTSRPLTYRELDLCMQNGVHDIVKIKIGYDGVVLANAQQAPYFDVTLRQLYRALAQTVPYNGQQIANPSKLWADINSTLPKFQIRLYGPPPSSGTRDAFIELVLEGGCATYPQLKALKTTDPAKYQKMCQTLRTDGVYIEAGENDQLIVEELSRDPTALGIFGFSFLNQNSEIVKGSNIDGIAPTFDTIYLRQYPLSRSLFFYVKKDQVERIPGLREYVTEFIDEWTWGPQGDLAEHGLIPMPTAEREHFHRVAKEFDVFRYTPAFKVDLD